MVQILVRVKDKETDSERDVTYKAYRDLISRYELIGQIDEAGNLMEGNPNLLPQHQTQAVKKDAVHAGEGGEKVTELVPSVEKIPEKENVPHETEIKERKKPGPKPKNA